MPSQYGYEKQSIEQIISQYIQEMISVIELAIGTTRKTESLEEAFITQTQLMPDGFFDHGDPGESCGSKDVVLKRFGEAIILFNDLKGSTKVIEWLEDEKLLCIYAAYMQYSSQLLGKVLDLIDGKVVESTGDGNYSIIYNLEEDNLLSFSKYANRFIASNVDIGKDPLYRQYVGVFDTDEIFDIKHIKFPDNRLLLKLQYFTDELPISLRFLFFLIFAKFNIAINKILDYCGLEELFFTRIGCQRGKCMVTRVKVDGHILQDKLIGTVIHEAAHQAQGK